MILGLAIQGKNKTKYAKTMKPNFLNFSFADITIDIIIENSPNQNTNGLPNAYILEVMPFTTLPSYKYIGLNNSGQDQAGEV